MKIGPQLAKTIPKNYNITYESYLNGNSVESMFIEPVTEYELQIEINNLSENKSAGHDDIRANMIKIISGEVIKPLAYIYNVSFETGKIPNYLKIALVRVTPIFKAKENNQFENYRLISVITCFSKLLEKLKMHKRLINYVEKTSYTFNFRTPIWF